PVQGLALDLGDDATYWPASGDLLLSNPLALNRTPDRAPLAGPAALVYTSGTDGAFPVVQTYLASDPGGAVPQGISETLTWDGSDTIPWTYNVVDGTPGKTYVLAVVVDQAVDVTGRYGWTLSITATFNFRGDVRRTITGTDSVLAQNGSPVG